MKRFILILGFVVFWKQWECQTHIGNGTSWEEPVLIDENEYFAHLLHPDASRYHLHVCVRACARVCVCVCVCVCV